MTDAEKLIEQLLGAGLSHSAIEAAWPSWWSDEAGVSPSGRTELRFALARRLGLEPKPLLGERVKFVWNDEARFKHLTTQSAAQRAVLTSFGMSISRALLRATPSIPITRLSALTLRTAILSGNRFVDLNSLIATCWAIGIPVIHLRVFPLEAKAMHAMVVDVKHRHAVLLGRDASYPAPVAFTLAHELGHIMLGHLGDAPALIDLEDPALSTDVDEQETEADRFALELLTGSAEPDIQTSIEHFNAPTLATSVLQAAEQYDIEPGTLALCVAHRKGLWAVAMSALGFIYSEKKPVWREVNAIANAQLAWDELGEEASHYMKNVIGLDDA